MRTTTPSMIKTVRPAFTLVEIIVSVTIFSLLIGVGISSYLNLSAALKRQNIQRELYNELYRVLQDTERFGKFFTIDYTWYESNQAPVNVAGGNEELVLVSKDNQSRVHWKKVTDEQNHSFLGVYREHRDELGLFTPDDGFAANTFEPLTSDKINLQTVRFFLFPDLPEKSFQPKVTFVLGGEMINPFATNNRESFSLQTTFSIRPYPTSS